MTAGGGGGGGGGGTGDVLFLFKPVGEIVTVSVLGLLSMKVKSARWISKKTEMKKESLYYHIIYKTLQYIPPTRAEAISLFQISAIHFFFCPSFSRTFQRIGITAVLIKTTVTARVCAAKFFNVFFFNSSLWFDLTYRSCGLPTRDHFKVSYTGDGSRGPFLESPGNFTGPKSNIQIEI